MNRRNFLRTTGAFSLPALLSNGLAADPAGFFTQFINPDSDKVLVLIRLSGGNDGLNTVIGLDQLDNLTQMRENVVLAQNNTLALNSTTALHGAMGSMRDLFNENKLGIVQAVGYPNQNRSHFRSTDIWSSGSEANEYLTTGWLGRYLELDHASFPDGYPNSEFPAPLAMTMGNVVSATCQGSQSNLSVVVNNPFNYLYIAPGGDTALPNTRYGTEVDFVRDLIGQSNAYGSIVQDSANAGNTLATNYTNGSLSNQLRNIATLISGGLQTKVYVATLGGFDTHSAQVAGSGRLGGRHGELMAELSDSIKAFTDDLELLGVGDRVLGLTFSEFGRRIRSNQSGGTDHGDAGPLFLFGNCVAPGILGDSPTIDTAVDQTTGVAYQYDFRDVYGSVLVDWFEVPTTTVQTLFGNSFTYLPIANGCANSLDVVINDTAAIGLEDVIEYVWTTRAERDNRGFTVERSEDGRHFRPIARVAANANAAGEGNYKIVDRNVVKDRLYYYRLVAEDFDGTLTTSSVQTARLRGSRLGEWSVGLPRPNPVTPDTYVKAYAPADGTADWEIIDAGGHRVRTGSQLLYGGQDNRIALNAHGLTPGNYVWRLRTADGHGFARKVIVGGVRG